MWATGAIDRARLARARAAYEAVKHAHRAARGTRRANLRAVYMETDDMAWRGAVTGSRLSAITLTLERNREWWTLGTIPRGGERIEFAGSRLVWQYYPLEGVHLQPLASFGKANALWRARRRAALRGLLDELLALGADRGGALAFEYLFDPQGSSATGGARSPGPVRRRAAAGTGCRSAPSTSPATAAAAPRAACGCFAAGSGAPSHAADNRETGARPSGPRANPCMDDVNRVEQAAVERVNEL